MDLTEATSIVFNRIQQVEPDYVTKIIGCLLLRDRTNQEMIRLALGTYKSIEEAIHNAKIDLRLASNSPLGPVSLGPRNLKYSSLNPPPHQLLSGYSLDQLSRYQNPHQVVGVASEYVRRRRNPIKTCHYYNRGFCKHGDNCKYLHDDRFSPALKKKKKSFSNNINEDDDDDQIFSLEKLEMEIVDILKSQRAPISIASLPMIYLERYKKSLQAQGYLTESQRHGKTGHSLTRLLSRITTITLIDRPHGQHFIVLAEDASKYFEKNNSLNNSKSRQIYLTFPADSPFTEDDVANYFSSNFGAVEDVRIPCQNKRMFGFVTFLDSDTVQMILSKGNPHYICGARVLVKPYKERSKLSDRKYHDRMEYRFHYPQQYVDDFDSMPTSSKFLQQLEIEAFRLAELELARKNNHQSFSNNNILNGRKVAQDCLNVTSGQGFSYWFGLVNAENERIRVEEKNEEDDSQINLPESPFANTISNLI